MSKKAENKLVPKLRFPEFDNLGEWDIKPLGDLCDEIFEKTKGRKYKLMSITSGIGLVSQIEKFGREIAGDSYKNYYVIHKGDFAYNKSSTKLYGEGEIALYDDDQIGAVPNSIFTCFRFHQNTINPLFAKYPFINNLHGNWLRKFIAVGARANGALQVNTNDLFSLPFPFPSPREQQKIAECLSSLDDLITVHSQKLEALKAHKKGLMQQIFPGDGETVPKLRFKEFKNEEKWVEKKLGDLAENLDSKRIPITSDQREKGDIRYYGASGIIDYVKDYLFDETLLCISEDGANLIDRNYPIAFTIYGKTWVNNHTHVLRFENFDTQILVEKYINSINIQDFLTGMAQPKLNRGKLDIIPILLPENPKEQKKIADCLLSLDEQIKMQTEKITGLKMHKKGLMQGLFPIVTI